MIKELRKLSTHIGMTLTTSVEDRIHERRQTKLSTLQAYLEDPHFLDSEMDVDRILLYATKSNITTLARDIYMRLFKEEEQSIQPEPVQPEEEAENPHEEDSGTMEMSPQPPKRKRSQDLREFKAKKPQSDAGIFISSSIRVLNAIKSNMKTYEASGKRPHMLDQVMVMHKRNKKTILRLSSIFN